MHNFQPTDNALEVSSPMLVSIKQKKLKKASSSPLTYQISFKWLGVCCNLQWNWGLWSFIERFIERTPNSGEQLVALSPSQFKALILSIFYSFHCKTMHRLFLDMPYAWHASCIAALHSSLKKSPYCAILSLLLLSIFSLLHYLL